MTALPQLLIFSRKLLVLFSAALLGAACDHEPQVFSTKMPDELLYYDDFSDESSRKWHTEADETGSSAIVDGTMVVALSAPATMQYTTMLDPLLGDFILEVEATALGPANMASYGVLIGIDEAGQFLRFEITSDGRFMIEDANADGSWTQYLDDWVRVDSIFQGVGATNKLRIELTNNQLFFFVNDDPVYSMKDSNLANGKIGLDLGTFVEPSAGAAFDNLVIFKP